MDRRRAAGVLLALAACVAYATAGKSTLFYVIQKVMSRASFQHLLTSYSKSKK